MILSRFLIFSQAVPPPLMLLSFDPEFEAHCKCCVWVMENVASELALSSLGYVCSTADLKMYFRANATDSVRAGPNSLGYCLANVVVIIDS